MTRLELSSRHMCGAVLPLLLSHYNIANIKMSDTLGTEGGRKGGNQHFSVYKVEILLVNSQTTVTKKP